MPGFLGEGTGLCKLAVLAATKGAASVVSLLLSSVGTLASGGFAPATGSAALRLNIPRTKLRNLPF